MKTVQLSLGELYVGPVRLLDVGHKCNALVVDPRYYPTATVAVWITGIHSAPMLTSTAPSSISVPDRFGNCMTAVAGQVLPLVPGLETWVHVLPYADLQFGTTNAQPVVFTLHELGDDSIISSRQRSPLGQILFERQGAPTPLTGNDQDWITAEQIPASNGLPVSIIARLEGGDVVDSAWASYDDWPLELVLRDAQWGGGNNQERVWLFPGPMGFAEIAAPVYNTKRGNSGSWALRVRYPAGARAGVDKAAYLSVQVVAGTLHPYQRYTLRHNTIVAAGTAQYTSGVAMLAGVSVQVPLVVQRNHTAGATHETNVQEYIPTNRGGPKRWTFTNWSLAASTRRYANLESGEIFITKQRFSVNPGNAECSTFYQLGGNQW